MLCPDCLQLLNAETLKHWRQAGRNLPYAFTDYRLQDQTLPAVIIDIATLPTGEVHRSRWGPADR